MCLFGLLADTAYSLNNIFYPEDFGSVLVNTSLNPPLLPPLKTVQDSFNREIDKIFIWVDSLWFGIVWYALVWFGMVWFDMVWYSMV